MEPGGITLPLFHPWDEPPADCSFRVFILSKHPRLFYLFIFYPPSPCPPPLTPPPPSRMSGELKGKKKTHPALLVRSYWVVLGGDPSLAGEGKT